MRSLAKTIVIIVVPILAAVLLVWGAETLGRGQEGESLKQLENSVRKAVMTCYATEGVYPPTVEYLEDHYGIQIDHNRFNVFYEIFGDNIMPQITVMEIGDEETAADDGDVRDPDAPAGEEPEEGIDDEDFDDEDFDDEGPGEG